MLIVDQQYNVPTGDAEEEAIASRALHSKDHKDFANCELSRMHYGLPSTDMLHSEANRPRLVLTRPLSTSIR